MTYFLDRVHTSDAGNTFRQLLKSAEIVGLPGAHNGHAALQAKAAGFQALYLSGAAVSASMGLPDLGLITVDDACFHIRQVAGASGLPVLVDGDTGYGGVLNTMAMVRKFEDCGAASVHIEDQVLPKKCGHLSSKKLLSIDEMAAKVSAAAKVRRQLFIMARTDAAASEGLDGAVCRANAYIDAGAEAIFPEALTSPEMFREFAQRVTRVPLLANMTEFGRTPHFTLSAFRELGYKMVIWPVSALRCANKAQEDLYNTIASEGSAQAMIPRMQTREELYKTIRYFDYESLDETIASSVVPLTPAGKHSLSGY